MKGKGKAKRKGKKDTGKLQKYMMTVNDFVKSKVGCDETEETEDGSGLRFVKKKNRKEMRKEQRKMKKAKIKNHYEGYKALKASTGDSEEVATLSDKQQTKKVNGKVKKDEPVSQQPKSTPVETAAGEKESRKKALLEANIAEDREIKRLERSLGYNKRKNKQKLPQSFADDGLDYILGVLDAGSAASGMMHDSDDDMDIAKEKLRKLEDSESEISGEEEEEQGDDSEEEGSELGRDGDLDTIEEDEIDEEEEDGMDEEGESEMDESAGKYVPPHLRDTGDDKRRAELERLKRQVKGLVNRLSEANMASISGQLEELYMSSSRKDMNDTLTEILLAACVTPALMPDRLLMEHVLLVSILHHTVGLEVGANFLETVVRQFAELYKSPGEGKECDNLVAMVAHLYNFQVVHALLIFDILKMLLGAFAEKDIELVLFVLKNVGFALRKDDALALKELISEAQSKASGVGTKFQDENRVRFMLETMLALKNNDMRKIPGYDPEPVERLRKLQRTLSSGGSDVKLRVSLENLLAAEQVGRWWIVGSSWSGLPMMGDQGNKTSKQTTAEGKFSAKVLDLARKQRMNTDIRRNIFCVIMTSEDYLDAFEKLIRLGLKDQQEREIVHVLMDCCLQEKSFNAFYAVLGEKFCEHDRRFQMTFQFSLWDKFKDLSSLSTSTFSNLVQLVTRFLRRKCLSLSILKVIEFGELDKPKVKFLRQVLTKLLKDTEMEDLTNIFGRISGIPKLGMLREGLKLFISHFLLKNAQSQGPAEQADLLSERAEVATKAMEAKETKLKL
uniref:Nucleolar MIF4G domain-containing protein 1 n=1 Tax=Oncorhynchus tshawytscha TaxID=74940 RepID=A0A8C8CYV9_ONCTS